MSSELSSKMRAYMAEIYRLVDRQQIDSTYVTSSQLADWLFVSPPAVNRMVNRLSELDLLVHQPYHGITITEKGRTEALKHIRCQRIAEAFLVQVMDISWLTVHEEAQRLSDGLSEAVLQRMYEMTGEPAFCPHGEPIPDPQGSLPPANDVILSQIAAGSKIRISRLITRESDRLQYMEALGLVPGQECELIHIAPFDGPMQLKLGREFRIIGNSLAQLIKAEVIT
ncbi:MAG: metal-dependent transcriptional regulator [Chloroflexota bacterium]|nr:metal-dependent transcriptional regulator [Chloroflexota bacterium]MDE2910902.1 metal-dependent transcriptional regulator [Chloroflexota bacterium]